VHRSLLAAGLTLTLAAGRLAPAATPEAPAAAPVRVTADLDRVVNTMRGGIGASWHAIEEPIPFSDKPDPVFGNKSHGGSGWGAYPPSEDDAAWAQIDRHARWLGLDWNRVEIEQRIYEPERGKFTWDGREMRILRRILDWCERNRADVFLQQMWSNVGWNAFPPWRDDPVGRVHSGPASMEDFAEGLAALVEHLVKDRRYTCIRWLSIVNEPNGGWSWWQVPPNQLLPLRPGLLAVRKALDARGIRLPLSGPDMTGGVPPLEPARFDFHDLLGAYDFHSYDEDYDWRSQGGMVRFDASTAAWAAWAHQRGKPLFLSEFGTMANGWGGDDPGPGAFASVLKDAELVVRRLGAGADGFNRWSFLNRGDLDGQWQFIDTWDRKEKKLLREYAPHPNTYHVLGLLSRFTARHSEVLDCAVEGGRVGEWRRVFAAALRSPKGEITVAAVNDAPVPFELSLEVRGLSREVTLHRYGVAAADGERADLRIEPRARFPLGGASRVLKDRLPPMAVAVYTTYLRAHDDDGVMAE
jgi:cellulase (glycosyl hydrolase family 5)